MKNCVRCGISCQPGTRRDPKARPFQGAEKGLCGDCAVTQLFLSPVFEAPWLGLLRNGIEALREPAIQEQFTAVLQAGRSDLQGKEINWERVIAQWELPFPKGYEPRKKKEEKEEDKP